MSNITIKTRAKLSSFGRDLPRLYEEANKKQSQVKYGFWDFVFGQIRDTYVNHINSGLTDYPDTIRLEGNVTRDVAYYIKELKGLGIGIGPFVSLIGGVLSYNIVGIGSGLHGLAKYGQAIADFENSNDFNRSLSALLKSYRLSQTGQRSFQLKKGMWITTTDGRGGMATVCPNGLDLPSDWDPDKYIRAI